MQWYVCVNVSAQELSTGSCSGREGKVTDQL